MSQKKKTYNMSGFGSIRNKEVNRNGKIYKYWEGRITVESDTGKQKQQSISGKTKKDVSAKMNTLLYELQQGSYIEPTKLLLNEWLDRWESKYLISVKDSTAILYSNTLQLYIRPELGQIRIQELSTEKIQGFYKKLFRPSKSDREPLSAKTIRNIHGILHKALAQAVKQKILSANPSDDCELPKVQRPDIRPFNDLQVARFLKAVTNHVHEYLYKITLLTGMREGEILGLQWDCVDLQKGQVSIARQLRKQQKKGGEYYFSSPKNGKTRLITIPPSVVHLFESQRSRQLEMQSRAGASWNNENNLVFTNATGGILSYRTVYDCYKRIVKQIGVPNSRFHDLRHTYAIISIKNGDDIKTVSENLGHATVAFTLDVYGHITREIKEVSAKRMEDYIQKISEPK